MRSTSPRAARPTPSTASQTDAGTPRRLNAPTRSFYAWILKLSQPYGYCFARNEYLARVQRRSESQIVRRIASLIEAGWLRREMVGGERRLIPLVIPAAPRSQRRPAREKLPLRLVPAPEGAHPSGEKCVRARRKTRTPAAENAHPHSYDALGDASHDATGDNNTDARTPDTEPAPAAANPAVVVEMIRLGVWEETAHRVARTLPEPDIRRILADPACRAAKRPAAWFAAVVQTGYRCDTPAASPPPRYAPPVLDDPEARARLQAVQEAHPGLTGRDLFRAVFQSLQSLKSGCSVTPARPTTATQTFPPDGRAAHVRPSSASKFRQRR